MKKLFIFLLAVTISSLLSCECDSDNPIGPQQGKTLIDTTVNASAGDVTVSIGEGVRLTIPRGISSENINVKIRAIDNLSSVPDVMKILKAYDIELSIGDVFDKELAIRFDLESDYFEGKTESDFAFGFYNSAEKKWQVFPEYSINIAGSYAECKTNHLTTVGFIEFVTSGGYSYKFVGDNVTVYYCSGSDSPIRYPDYDPPDQSWHLPTSDPAYAPLFIQDVAHYIAEARDAFADSPHNLEVASGNINVYVKDLSSNDGEYGTISGAIYLNNKVSLPGHVSGVGKEDVLAATCAHELLHLIQDNYYVMNKGSIGMWWLEATATQADRMVWGNSLLYSESEMYSIESNSTLLETLSKSWDDCNSNPNWYLAGCFLQYMSTYREGAKLNVADAIKAGGDATSGLVRVMLNEQVKSDLGTNLMDEYRDYIQYLFFEGNENLSAFPFDKSFNAIETSPSLTKSVRMSKKDHTQSVTVSLPYLATKLISVSNIENSEMRVNYDLSKLDAGLEAYLCRVNAAEGKFELVESLYKGISGDVELKARAGGDVDNFVILLINTGFTEGSKEASLTFKTSEEFKEFGMISFKLEGADGDIQFSNGYTDSQWSIGFVDFYDQQEYKVLSKSFSGNKVKLTFEERRDSKVQYTDYVSTVTVEGEYNSAEFTYLKLREEIVKYKEEWSDDKDEWVKHKITEIKTFEYNTIPFNIQDGQYNIVYSHMEHDKSKIKSKLTNISHTIEEVDDEGDPVESYQLEPIAWSSVANYFNLSMITTKK
ncbi:MAG: hypothetical protein ACLFQX_07430 [Candidatus Kapaibacterium sp.]